MGYRVLERILIPDRIQKPGGTFTEGVRPLFHEREAVFDEEGPYLVTRMNGTFLPITQMSKDVVRCAFFQCPLEQEHLVVSRLLVHLAALPIGSVSSTQRLPKSFNARSLVVPPSVVSASGVSVEDALELMGFTGNLGVVSGIQLVLSEIEVQPFLVSKKAGYYVRTGDYLGLILSRPKENFLFLNQS